MASDIVYPRGGWRRAATYVLHRVRRLPDQPHRIGRGVAAGVFISFTPLFGLHFLASALIAWLIRGNILAALLATFVGNPITFPFIAAVSLTLGRWMLGLPGQLSPQRIFGEFSRATAQLWHNFLALFTEATAHWDHLAHFSEQVFLPYLIGGLGPGLIAAVTCHYLTVPVIRAYHNRRVRKMEARIARARAEAARLHEQPPAPPRDQ
ncbi:MAG: DUF2062 domain-containing protein [Paracoccus sp. (in: a-proteobacteria)]|uniref:DUF2062 domain-containing protein n=1 Tax=Paracoccus sp. TaxID=267 RepID=UPI0026DF1743|nr:DUF2062 domain-containing protein [Paracoccus sp. (in: a-proteobacteria)]MDO5613156.1 DUF2062 domain-containing protein [Paracoccus sp. (in: a-proteobacteria)]